MELPQDMNHKIAMYLDYQDLTKLCESGVTISNVCNDSNFWRDKIRYDGIDLGKKLNELNLIELRRLYDSWYKAKNDVELMIFYARITGNNIVRIPVYDDFKNYLYHANKLGLYNMKKVSIEFTNNPNKIAEVISYMKKRYALTYDQLLYFFGNLYYNHPDVNINN